jgi:hypothetical protein
MKNIIVFMVILFSSYTLNAQEYAPFYKVTERSGNTETVAKIFENVVTDAGFEVIGKYHPENKNSLYVVCFTSDELKNLSTKFKDRGALAAVIKMGFVEKDGQTEVSILNPYYLFYAYWGKQMGNHEDEVVAMAKKILAIAEPEGNLQPFGGFIDKEDLPKYHYKIMMPYFDDPDELNEFDSFEEGLSVIRKNLQNNDLNAVKVYELVIPGKEIAVFGIGLLDKETGEPSFLPVIGESHIAAMPYEIILQGKEATSLEGKYRFALFWPELSMGEFMKIRSAPGDVSDTFEAICGND